MANKKNPNKEVIAKTKEETKEVEKAKQTIPRKKIYIIIGIIVVAILIGIYIYWLQGVRDEERYSTSYLLSSGTVSLEIKNLDEVDQILSESPTEYFVLITYTGAEETYNLEQDIKTIIDNYKLSDSFYYLNIESMMETDNYLTRLNNTFDTNMITTVPIILYFRDGQLVDTVTRNDDNIINAGDFQKLLDIYEYEGE